MAPRRPRFAFSLPWRSRAQIDREVDAELAFHLDMRASELVAQGVDPAEARRRARTEFGDLEHTRRYCRETDYGADRATRLANAAAEWAQDTRYALRALRHAPGFAVVSLLTLALAVGANTAIFSVARAVLLRPLPFGAPNALLALYETHAPDVAARYPLSPPNFADYRAGLRTLTDVAAYTSGRATWRPAAGDPSILRSVATTANAFALLRVAPLLGRALSTGDDAPSSAPKVVLSYDFWRRALGGDPAVVGRRLVLDDRAHEIVGVMPRGFTLAGGEDLWLPLDLSGELATAERTRKQHYLQAFARLRPGVSLDAARADLAARARELAVRYPEANTDRGALLLPLHEAVAGDLRPALLLLAGAAGLLLLIACANLANVTLSRAIDRRREMALRAAIGAGRGRLARQLLTESSILALAGGAVGVALATVATRVLLALGPEALPAIVADVRVDRQVLLFSVALSLGTGLVLGLAPVLAAAHADLQSTLRDGARGTSGGRGGARVRRTLVVAQIGLAVVLLVGAGLLFRSFTELTSVRLGFDPAHVLSAQLAVGGVRYDSAAAVNQLYEDVLGELRRAPGITVVGAVSDVPTDGRVYSTLGIVGEPFDARHPPDVGFTVVRGDYFGAMRIPLRSGRLLTAADRDGAPSVVLLNEAAARRFFPKGGAIGRRVRLGPDQSGRGLTIVGIVGDTREIALDVEARPTVYVPHEQNTWWRSLVVVVRATGDPRGAIPALRRAVKASDPTLALRDVRPVDAVLGASLAARRFALGLTWCFAAVSLALAAVGIYGVLAYSVTTRAREFGVRRALGATARSLLVLVVRQGLAWALAGVAIGLAGALGAGRLLRAMLYGITPTDAPTLVAVAAALAIAVVLACLAPAVRAMRVSPITSMRGE